LDPLTELFRRLENGNDRKEPVDYWLGRYQWLQKDKPKALRSFGRALGESPASGSASETGRVHQVSDVIGRIFATPNTNDWLAVFKEAIPKETDRKPRHWELLVLKIQMATLNPNMDKDLVDDLISPEPTLIADVRAILKGNHDRPDLQIAAHLVLHNGLSKGLNPAWEKLPRNKRDAFVAS